MKKTRNNTKPIVSGSLLKSGSVFESLFKLAKPLYRIISSSNLWMHNLFYLLQISKVRYVTDILSSGRFLLYTFENLPQQIYLYNLLPKLRKCVFLSPALDRIITQYFVSYQDKIWENHRLPWQSLIDVNEAYPFLLIWFALACFTIHPYLTDGIINWTSNCFW